MTYEEAHKYIENLQREMTKHRFAYSNELINANGKSIEALEKQIPKTPTVWGDGYSNGELVLENYECPNCGCIYDFDTDGKLKHCHECGQAIDWS